MIYKHTQTGYLVIFVLLAVVLLYGVIFAQSGFNLTMLTVMLLVLFLLGSFTTLNVSIDKSYLKIKFGYGISIKLLSFVLITAFDIYRTIMCTK